MKLTGAILNGNFIGSARHSCAIIDSPTTDRVTVELDGESFTRTVYRRERWRNMGECELIAEFVIINGTCYEVEDSDVNENLEPSYHADEASTDMTAALDRFDSAISNVFGDHLLSIKHCVYNDYEAFAYIDIASDSESLPTLFAAIPIALPYWMMYE